MRRMLRVLVVLALVGSTWGCANMNSMQQRMLRGGAIGTAAGVGIAAVAGGPLIVGAVTGAAAGAVGGVIMDQMQASGY